LQLMLIIGRRPLGGKSLTVDGVDLLQVFLDHTADGICQKKLPDKDFTLDFSIFAARGSREKGEGDDKIQITRYKLQTKFKHQISRLPDTYGMLEVKGRHK
jgi:hypothetical protein